MRWTCLALLMLSASFCPALAVMIDNDGATTFQPAPPTDDNIPGWTTGWPASGVTGWDYVGSIKGTSGVYLGDRWVMTVGHVGAGPFILAGVTYQPVPKSEKAIVHSDVPADLIMFRISTAPALPPLIISSSAPVIGDSVVMIGNGGGHGKTWGMNTISVTDVGVRTPGLPFHTVDFGTSYGDANLAKLVTGDSGGGAFIYNTLEGRWELAGINEAIDPANNSYMVQLGNYSSQIDRIRYGLWSIIIKWTFIALACLVALFAAWKLWPRHRHKHYR